MELKVTAIKKSVASAEDQLFKREDFRFRGMLRNARFNEADETSDDEDESEEEIEEEKDDEDTNWRLDAKTRVKKRRSMKLRWLRI